jgi:hypothetical protein
MLFLQFSVFAQTTASGAFNYGVLHIEYVDLAGQSAQTKYRIGKDDKPVAAPFIYLHESPAFGSSATTSFSSTSGRPVALLSGQKGKITAKLQGCGKSPIYMKGDRPDGYDAPPQLLDANGVYPWADLATTFPAGQILFFDPFEMTWFVSTSSSGPWIEVGKSQHPLYVVKKTTGVSTEEHSVLYYSCKAAQGLTNDDQIAEAIFQEFADRKVSRRDNPSLVSGVAKDMTYWGGVNPFTNNNGIFWSIDYFLYYEDGRCGSWANFMEAMLKVQGVNCNNRPVFSKYPKDYWQANPTLLSDVLTEFSTSLNQSKAERFVTSLDPTVEVPLNTAINVIPNPQNHIRKLSRYHWQDPANPGVINRLYSQHFLVKNWDFLLSQSTGQKLFYYNMEYYYNYCYTVSFVEGTTNFTFPCFELDGMQAQGSSSDPQSSFADHAVVEFNGKWFDPSYGGVSYASLVEWEDANIDGTGVTSIYTSLTGVVPASWLLPTVSDTDILDNSDTKIPLIFAFQKNTSSNILIMTP